MDHRIYQWCEALIKDEMRSEDIIAYVDKLDKEAVCLDEISIVITDVGLRHGCLNSFVQNWL